MIAQNATHLARTMAMVNIKFSACLFFANATNHASVIDLFTDFFPFFISQSISELKFFSFAIFGCAGAFTPVILMTRLATAADIFFV